MICHAPSPPSCQTLLARQLIPSHQRQKRHRSRRARIHAFHRRSSRFSAFNRRRHWCNCHRLRRSSCRFNRRCLAGGVLQRRCLKRLCRRLLQKPINVSDALQSRSRRCCFFFRLRSCRFKWRGTHGHDFVAVFCVYTRDRHGHGSIGRLRNDGLWLLRR